METLFRSGTIIDVILVLVALEAAILLGWRAWRGGWPSAAALACNLASGAALMLALRGALSGGDWTVLAGCLGAALVVHLADLWFRFREADRGG